MKIAATPPNEKERISALYELNILDTVSEERFDRITRLATRIFSCEFSTISLIDINRQWFKSEINVGLCETSRASSFCSHTILKDDVFVVSDTHSNEDFKDNPLVLNAPFIRFYAGIKISVNGHHIGSLCVFDTRARKITDAEANALQDLANIVEDELKKNEVLKTSLVNLRLHKQLEESQKLARVRNVLLEKVFNSQSLHPVLRDITKAVELEYTDQFCSILLLKGNQLQIGAAPSLPEFYNNAIAGVEIGVGQGSCGTTAFTGKRTIVDDISTHSYWEKWADLALSANLQACWSEPIKSADGKILGSFAIYHDKPSLPTAEELERIKQFAHVASIAIERYHANEVIWRQANFDQLTQLPNRKVMQDHLTTALDTARRDYSSVAVLFIDLDNFKDINDTLGHNTGDDLLIACARRISKVIQEEGIVARLGGDEFVVIINDVKHLADIDTLASKLINEISRSFTLDDAEVFTSASIGITLYPNDADNVESLLKNADQAMYAAKTIGKNSYHYYTESMQELALRRMSLIGDLRNAITNNELFIVYQPIYNLNSGEIEKAEALLRWRHPIHGLISPLEFISLAEDTGLINEISDWVFKQACRQLCFWRENYLPNLQVAINTSPLQYLDTNKGIAKWLNYLEEAQIPAQALILEITERLLMGANSIVADTLSRFRDAGVQVALDDFGTGYSSISYLQKFKIDIIKIDKSFVHAVDDINLNKALCEIIIMLGSKLNVKTVAEGIETPEQHHSLKKLHCDYGQGYWYSKPVTSSEFTALLITKRAD